MGLLRAGLTSKGAGVSPTAAGEAAPAPGMQLLAQIDTDDAADMMWGDVGTLYWLIRPEDLAARNFEASSFTAQSS